MSGPIRRRVTAGAAAAALSALVVAGCATTVDGTAMKAGTGGSRGGSADKYPNLLKECDVLTTDILAKTVGADPLDIQSTFVGAICRWQALSTTGLVDITRMWFEQGSLENERKIAESYKYKVENRAINGIAAIVMRGNDPNGGCGVAADAAGVVGWWVNPQTPGTDACAQAIKLMELTLATNS